MREVGDVEQRQLQALHAAVARRLLADAEQQLLADRVQVGGVAGDLQLADDARVVGVGQVERVERVGLAERDDVADVADEADRVDPLAEAEAADLAALEQVPVAPASVVTLLSASAPKPSVVAARSTPLCSDIANWLSSVPGTAPLAE